MLFGGLDVSTQSTKLLLVDVERGSVRHQDAVVYDSDLPRYRTRDGARSDADAGVSESDPRMWIDAVSMLFDRLARSDVDVSAIRAISVSGQQHGLVCLDASGELARPMAKLWNDVSTAGESTSSLALEL